MKKDIIKILIRFAVIGLALIAFNIIYTIWFFQDDVQKHSPIINKVKAVQDSCDILYVGESSNLTTSHKDNERKHISEFLDELIPEQKVKDISKGALHADIYYTLLSHIPERSLIKTVVVTMNLRSFNAQWIYSELETPLMKSMVLLRERPALLSRFILSFRGYDLKSPRERQKQVERKWERDDFDLPFAFPHEDADEWDADVWRKGSYNPDGTRNRKLRKLAAHYVKAYAFQIDPDNNPRIDDFDKIVELAKERGWNLVFNLLAENTEKADFLLGEPINYFFEYNRKLLIDRYQREGVIVCDNLYNVTDSLFIDQHWTTEHYFEEGRRIIAKNVADSLRVFLK